MINLGRLTDKQEVNLATATGYPEKLGAVRKGSLYWAKNMQFMNRSNIIITLMI